MANQKDIETTEQIARETRTGTSNGNREDQNPGKAGGAERGGPDLEKAEERQPPQSETPSNENNQ